MSLSSEEIVQSIAKSIYDRKGMNIIAIDVRKLTSLTDFCIIAEGNVSRHLKALSSEITEQLKAQGVAPVHVDGDMNSDWIVVDYGVVVVHLFIPEVRLKYRLEELWQEGELVPLDIVMEEV
ncbi:MAG: ribosome silencing factor [Waddliaceae bacterium]|nr:ribosome silencing factor [Waddliaceae bacterium]